MTIEFGPGIVLGPGITVGDASGPPPSPLTSADVYFPMQTILLGTLDGDSVPAMANYGTAGSAYDATSVPGRTQPTVATINGCRVLSLEGYINNQLGFNLASSFNMSVNGSLFMVGWTTVNSGLYSRCMGFGGQPGSFENCFFGYSSVADNSTFLFRNTGDGGMTLAGLSPVSGLKAFGLVKTGNTIVYYDNSATPVTWPGTASGTYVFETVGYRWFSNPPYVPQPSTGYLGDVAWFSTALNTSEAGNIMTTLKSFYGIA